MPRVLEGLTDAEQALSIAAWTVRKRSHIYGATAVGCAIRGANGEIFAGCNVEHRYRSHDVHAEVNAITNLVSHGCATLIDVWIAAERDHFTPCGACLDWIFQFGGPEAGVIVQGSPAGPATRYQAAELMPFYPR